MSNHRKCNDGGDDEDLVVGELNSAKTREVVITKFVIYDRLIFAKKIRKIGKIKFPNENH